MIFNKVLNNLPKLSLKKRQVSKKITYFKSGSEAKVKHLAKKKIRNPSSIKVTIFCLGWCSSVD